jgi:UDP-glucose 4-epimerase
MKILVTGGAGYIGRIQPEEIHVCVLTGVD